MKKYTSIVAALVACLLILLSLASCAGKSAYEIAVENGFKGSESEWLASLAGKDGKDGEDGEKGEKGDAGDRGLTGWNGEDGKDGKDGAKGDTGEKGEDGKDAVSVTKTYVNGEGHLIIEMSDGTVTDAGFVGALNTDAGKQPTISESELCLDLGSFYIIDTNLDYPIWSSSDISVARIAANGLIVAMGEGKTTITVSSPDGKTASCELTVLDIEYAVSADGNAVITEYRGSLSSIEIPASIGGYPVTAIDDWAFFDNQSIKSISLPDSVTTIGYGAFSSCASLESIDLGEGLISLGQSAFSDCTALEGITLPESLEDMAGAVFYGCTSLKEITIPSKIKVLGGSTFETCYSLESVNLAGVEVIGGWAFYDCRALTEITLPASLNEIGEAAFRKCSALTSVTFENPNTVYWTSSFDGCIFVPAEAVDGYLSVTLSMYAVMDSNVRLEPSLDAEVVEYLDTGDEVTVTGVNLDEGWARIDLGGTVHFVRWSLLSFDPIENI